MIKVKLTDKQIDILKNTPLEYCDSSWTNFGMHNNKYAFNRKTGHRVYDWHDVEDLEEMGLLKFHNLLSTLIVVLTPKGKDAIAESVSII